MVESRNGAKQAQEDCTHYWRIASPAGQTSTGVCRICGASREFQNYTQRQPLTRARRADNQTASN